ncbi:pseudaminic acid synthase [Azospirillum soli]|uniref:pseudaminic acid synthase n=1 Tax=Azospirillum soli TaxID=1304799 RepID=UPI001AE93E80|nr:pseudaminic acid synthase [Azospirillum soli]MBP2316061.1 N-acetylneuraminate synthase [Azospirillum soli]
MSGTFTIAGRPVGPDHPPYVVAELSANHNGDIGRAVAIMRAAKEAGADAVKLQTYTADTMTIDHSGPDFRIQGGLWDGYKLYDLYREAQTPWDWHDELFAEGRRLGITVFSTPFDATAVDLLEKLDNPVYKIASFEVPDLPLIARVAQTGKPIIMSTGMADLGEISDAVRTARENGARDLILLHCVSAYPAPAREANLRTISHLAEAFGVATGLSDHTLGTAVSVVAVGQGAVLIEKHFTLNRADGGPDGPFSLEPDELRTLVTQCCDAWEALGRVSYERAASERPNMIFRRSLYIVRDMAEGEVFTEDSVRVIRPGYGMAPKELPRVLGRRARRAIPRGTALDWPLID